jgi:adenylate cyclase
LVAGYEVLEAIDGRPAQMMKVELPRKIYTQGQQSLSYFILALIVAGVAFGAILVLFLQFTVLWPLTGLMGVADQLAQGEVAVKVNYTGRTDELGRMAQAFQRIVDYMHQRAEEAEMIAQGDLAVEPEGNRLEMRWDRPLPKWSPASTLCSTMCVTVRSRWMTPLPNSPRWHTVLANPHCR